MSVQVVTLMAYKSPRAGRRFFTLRAACGAEARAIIQRKYPTEKAEYDGGYCTYPGSHWRDLPHSDKMLRRVTRLVRAEYCKARVAP